MKTFRSTTQTQLGYQDRGHTFNKLYVQDDGACLSVERNGARAIAAKGLIVRYANPFASAETPQIVYEAKESILSLCVGADAHLYAVSSKKLHTNATGSWKAKAVKTTTKDGYFVTTIVAANGALWLADYHGVHRREGDAIWTTVASVEAPTSLAESRGEVYVGLSDGAGFWNGTSLVPLAGIGALGGRTYVEASDGEMFVYCYRDAYRGRQASGFSKIPFTFPSDETHIDRCLHAVGATYVVTYDGLFRVEDSSLAPVMKATGWIARACSGNAAVLWIANGTELLCTDGKGWKTVRRVHDDQTKA